MSEEIEIIESELPAYEQSNRASFDIQVATAKKYPREIKRAIDNVIAIVTMDNDTAISCGYSLPRGSKSIMGPSVHLARMVAQQWKNLRVEARGTVISDKYVTAEAVAFDLESNFAVKIEAKRKIIDRYGKRYNDDMINMTMSVASAIALRNAIFAVVPKAVIKKCYEAAQHKITGDLSDETKLAAKRVKVFAGFKDTYKVEEDEILKLFGKQSIQQISKEELASLIGLAQGIKDGDTTVNDAFNRTNGNPDGENVKKVSADFENEGDNKAKGEPEMKFDDKK